MVDGAQKMMRVYDSQMKSGAFTAAQNKKDEGEYLDSISEFVLLCEKQGFIPQYYTDGPQDKVDRVIADMQYYTHNLVTEEMGLGNLIEQAIKNLEKEKEQIKAAAEAGLDDDEDSEDDNFFDYSNGHQEITDQDFSDLKDFEEQQSIIDSEYIADLAEEESKYNGFTRHS